jgi:hypothetical protein
MKYQKIRPLGHRTLKQLWDGEVEITEKVDGSQYRWWRELTPGMSQRKIFHHGTKRTELHLVDGGVKDKLFNPVVRHMEEHGHKVPPSIDCIFGETLAKPKHNTLKYNQVPKGHLAIWGAYDGSNDHWLTHAQLRHLAFDLMVDVVPLCGWSSEGQWGLDEIDKALEKESFLGGAKIEGLVFKNYGHDLLIGDEYIPFLAGKYVSEKFKEQHIKNWSPKSNQLDDYLGSWATEPFWMKAIQHLRDDGKLEYTPRDIGALMKELHRDLEEEAGDDIKDWLYNHFIKQIKRRSAHGFPEFYKRWLVENG